MEKFQKFEGPSAVKGKPKDHNLKLTLNILKLMMKSKKKFFGVFNISFLKNLIGRCNSFFIS